MKLEFYAFQLTQDFLIVWFKYWPIAEAYAFGSRKSQERQERQEEEIRRLQSELDNTRKALEKEKTGHAVTTIKLEDERAGIVSNEDELKAAWRAIDKTASDLADEKTGHTATTEQLRKETKAHQNTKKALADVTAAHSAATDRLREVTKAYATTKLELSDATAYHTAAICRLSDEEAAHEKTRIAHKSNADLIKDLEADMKLRDPLLEIGVKICRRFFENSHRIRINEDYKKLGDSANDSNETYVGFGNAAAHEGNLIADAALFKDRGA